MLYGLHFVNFGAIQIVLLNSAGVSELIERFRNVRRSLIPELPRNDVNFRRRFEFYLVRTERRDS